MKLTKSLNHHHGYSLIELCVALLLMSISLYGLSYITSDFYSNYKYIQMKEQALGIKQNLKTILNNPQMCAKQFQAFVADFENLYKTTGFDWSDNGIVYIDLDDDTINGQPKAIYFDETKSKALIELNKEAEFSGSGLTVESIKFENLVRNVTYSSTPGKSVSSTLDGALTHEFSAELKVTLRPVQIKKPDIIISLPLILQASSIGFITSCFNKTSRPLLNLIYSAQMWSFPNNFMHDDSKRMLRYWPAGGGDVVDTLISTHQALPVSGTCPTGSSVVSVNSYCKYSDSAYSPVGSQYKKMYNGQIVEVSTGVYMSTCNDEFVAVDLNGRKEGRWDNDLVLICQYDTNVN